MQMDMGEIDGLMKMAQIALTKAQEQKAKAEEENIREDTSTVRGDNKRGKGQLQNLLEDALLKNQKGETEFWNTQGARTKYKRDFEGYIVDQMETDLKAETYDDEKAKIVAEALGAQVDVELKRAGVELTEEQTRKIYHEIIQNYIKAGAAAVGSLGLVVGNAIRSITGKTTAATRAQRGQPKFSKDGNQVLN